MNKFFTFTNFQAEYLINTLTSVNGYTLLFKGGITLMTICLLSIQQVSTIAIPIEDNAYKLKFEVELSQHKKYDSIPDMECNLAHETYSKCMYAKYKKEMSSNSFKALYSWLEFLFVFSGLMLTVSVIGFLAHPHFHSSNDD